MLAICPETAAPPRGSACTVFDTIKALVVGATGHVRLAESDQFLAEKIARRITARRIPSMESYLHLISSPGGKDEFDALIAELTIGETSFFRHSEQFDALRDQVLPACLARNAASRQLRIWSAGCANGAEAYSLAALVHTLLGDGIADWSLAIVGSDINRAFLAEAERGHYSAWTLRETNEDQRRAFFLPRDGGWSVRERYKRNVRFVHHNLVGGALPCFDKFLSSFDIILCRNVMIYLDAANNRRLADRLATVLVEDGWLFTAPADFNPRLDDLLTREKLSSGAFAYRNKTQRPPHPATKWTSPQPAPEPLSAMPANSSERNASPSPRRRGQTLRAKQPVRRGPVAKTTVKDAPPTLDAIIALADRGEWDMAAHRCTELLRTDSCNAAAHYYDALVQLYAGRSAGAELALKRAVYLDPNFALAHYQLGLMHKEAHEVDRCAKSFANALSALGAVPDDAPASPCGRITARELQDLAALQLALLNRPGQP
jgi:chemotaxis protein methyltransferase CheR